MSQDPTHPDNDSATGDEPASKPKIIVDSDWKEQVAKEKAAAAAKADDSPANTSAKASTETASSDTATATLDTEGFTNTEGSTEEPKSVAAEQPSDASGSGQLPEPTFEVLVSMLFTQAMSSLGQIPNPQDGQTHVDKPMAKHSIDMIEMLGKKTEGNLSENESKLLNEALHALRMAYVSVRA